MNDLIDRYVAEVGRHLPDKLRPDIEREIRSLLEDSLEDRSREAGHPPDEAMVVALLKEFGEPQKVARSYAPPRYLVGPTLFPTFISILKPVVVAIGAGFLISFGISVSRPGLTLSESGLILLQSLASFWQASLMFFGILTLVFAILEHTAPRGESKDADWDPRKLKPVTPEASRVSSASLLTGIVLNIIALFLFNVLGNRIGLYIYDGGVWHFIPVLSRVFFLYVPWFSAIWALEIVLYSWVLRDGSWKVTSRLASAGLNLLGLILALVMLTGPSIVEVTPQTLAALQGAGLTEDVVKVLETVFQIAYRLVLVFVVIGKAADMGKDIYRGLWKPEA
ncbi:hypothetical protein ATHL_00458 [Anaerolinea thermolimosa]|uniref:hypothetical protein n=1 Tax=Anaerolinea thermolimosa TaxID=229919 RepID=UPI000780EBCC|nr:hypothetical protein [Anaerolinea thermolimosa]GAP05617.1 hypothetical protein ATHL_00458 [Anaerolinea thermolimosa]